MRKLACAFGCIAVGGLSFLSPFSAVPAGADTDTQLYTHPLFSYGSMSGHTTSFFPAFVSGTVGSIGYKNGNISHSLNGPNSEITSTGTAVFERLYEVDNMYVLATQGPNSWYESSINSAGYCRADLLFLGYGGGSLCNFSGIQFSYDYSVVGMAFSVIYVDIRTDYEFINVDTGARVRGTVYNTLLRADSRTTGDFELMFDFDLTGLNFYPHDIICYSFTTTAQLRNADNRILESRHIYRVPFDIMYELDTEIYKTYISQDVQFSSIYNAVWNSVTGFFQIEIFPHFHIYDIIAIVLGCTLLGFALKFFLGG